LVMSARDVKRLVWVAEQEADQDERADPRTPRSDVRRGRGAARGAVSRQERVGRAGVGEAG
jgi:hypothetical protein